MKNILLVEDEEQLREVISLNLDMEGYNVLTAKDGTGALAKFDEQSVHLVILDVMLPELNGFEVCRRIREKDGDVPILFLTAKNRELDRIEGLKIGGDDYLGKPFNLEELILRIKNLLKRSESQQGLERSDPYTIGYKSIDFRRMELKDKNTGHVETISKRESDLLYLLIDNEGVPVSREEILEKVWGVEEYPSARTIDNFILGFRKRFESDPKNPVHFISIRGVGYKFQK